VWAALQPAALRFADSNSLVIETDRGMVVVDSQSDPAKVRLLASEIRRRTGQKVRFVVSTHWHGDHTQGNAVYREVFGEDVRFLAHSTWWRDVRDRGLPQLAEELDATRAAITRAKQRLASGRTEDGGEMSEEETADLAAGIARAEERVERLASLDIPPPTLTFTDRLTLHLTWQGEPRPIRLIHLRGHTRGDVVVHLPTERLLATGDLLDDLPFGGHGYPEEWIHALDTLDALDFETVVPGHGSVQEGRRQLERVRTLLSEIVTRAKTAVRRGEGPETAKETAMASEAMRALREGFVGDDPLAGRAFDAFVPATFERAYLEVKGELPD
jgi:cyclase